jgi:hypothetical protein
MEKYMKRMIFIMLVLFIPQITNAAPPSRVYTYTSGDTINPGEVSSNEDVIFNYLTRGVDTYVDSSITTSDILDGTITNADISGTAGITYGKLAGSIPDSKLDTISTAGKVSGAALTSLTSIPSAAGAIPAINLQAVYPVGSIYLSTVSTNPNTLFGFGTWTACAEGRVLVGVGTSDAAYAAAATGGESTHALTEAEGPQHRHGVAITSTLGGGGGSAQPGAGTEGYSTYSGSGTAHNNMPPYLVVYIWERTA